MNTPLLTAIWRVIHRADLARCEGTTRPNHCALASSWEFDEFRAAYEQEVGCTAAGPISKQPWYKPSTA